MQILFKVISLLISSNLLMSVCSAETTFDYDLDKPALLHVLPDFLKEVSGLTKFDSSHVACVQDELGIVYIYNFIKGKMSSQHSFNDTGDFEGIAYTGDSFYILRSDGRLTEWSNFKSGLKHVKHYKLRLFTADNEGLSYDKNYNRLLIIAKSKPIDHDEKDEKYIYSFDITQKQLIEKPLYSINIKKLAKKAGEFNIPDYRLTKKGKKKPFNFRPSGLAINPLSDDIYIISAADRLLLVINRKNEVIHMKQLDSKRFNKAEGITFLDDGTMIITNEAAGKKPTLLVFNLLGRTSASY